MVHQRRGRPSVRRAYRRTLNSEGGWNWAHTVAAILVLPPAVITLCAVHRWTGVIQPAADFAAGLLAATWSECHLIPTSIPA